MPEQTDELLCAVTDCPEQGRRGQCLWDRASHYHGLQHYDERALFVKPTGLTFRADGTWRGICPAHQAQLRQARKDWERLERIQGRMALEQRP